MLPRAWEAHRGAWPAAGGGVSGGSAEVCGCRATDVGTLLEGFVCEEVTIMVANKGEGVMVKEDLVTHRSIKEDAAFPAYQPPRMQTLPACRQRLARLFSADSTHFIIFGHTLFASSFASPYHAAHIKRTPRAARSKPRRSQKLRIRPLQQPAKLRRPASRQQRGD